MRASRERGGLVENTRPHEVDDPWSLMERRKEIDDSTIFSQGILIRSSIAIRLRDHVYGPPLAGSERLHSSCRGAKRLQKQVDAAWN